MEYVELSLLNACISHGKEHEVMAKVEERDFSESRRPIFRAVKEVVDEGITPDLVVVAEKMEKWGIPEPFKMLSETLEFITPGNVETQCKQLKRNALSRALKQASSQIARLASDEEPETAYEQACELLMEIRGEAQGESLKRCDEVLRDYISDLERRFDSGEEFDGLTTGFTEIDNRWMGMKPQNLIVVAGRPGLGKTSFGMNVVEHSIRQGNTWLVFSMEMSATELMGKMVSSAGKLSYTKLSNAGLQEDDWPKLTSAASVLKGQSLFIDERSALSVQDMRSRAYEVRGKAEKLDGIFVDYVQLMRGSGQNREAEIGGISRGLKALAKELGVPIIAISQLNRSCESRPNKRPVNSDLRDSGAIEQDANIVAFVYRDDFYNEDSYIKGIAEIITSKFRGGKTGTDCLAWQGDYQRFDNLEYRPDVEAIAEQQEESKSRGKDRAF